MKEVIAVSMLSFVLISMGALYSMGFLRFGPEVPVLETAVDTDKVTLAKVQFQAIETQKINLQRSVAEMLSLRNDMELEKRIVADMRRELEGYLANITEASGPADTVHVEQIAKLAKLYDSMKPESAAPIASSLTMDLLVEIISSMKDKKAARLMAALPPELSAEVSRRLGTRSAL